MPRRTTRKPAGVAPIRKFTDELKERFCQKLAKCGLIAKSAHAIGVSHRTIEEHRKKDPEFLAAFEQAMALYRDRVEQEVHDRAIEGWEEPVFYQGKQTSTKLVKSDRLLELLAKRYVHEYRERFQGEINVKGGVLVVGAQMTAEQWQAQFGGVRRPVENEAQPPPEEPAGPLAPLNPAPGTEPGSVRLERPTDEPRYRYAGQWRPLNSGR